MARSRAKLIRHRIRTPTPSEIPQATAFIAMMTTACRHGTATRLEGILTDLSGGDAHANAPPELHAGLTAEAHHPEITDQAIDERSLTMLMCEWFAQTPVPQARRSPIEAGPVPDRRDGAPIRPREERREEEGVQQDKASPHAQRKSAPRRVKS